MKNFVKKLTFAAALLILIVMIFTFVWILLFRANQEEHYRDVYSESFVNSLADYDSAMTAITADLNAFVPEIPSDFDPSDSDIPAGYSAWGKITVPASNQRRTIEYKTGGEDKQITVTSDYYQNWKDDFIMFVSDGVSFYGKKTPVFTEEKPNPDPEVPEPIEQQYDIIVLVKNSKPVEDISKYSFDEYLIIDGAGFVIDASNGMSSVDISSNIISGEYRKINNESYLVYAGPADDAFIGYSLVALINGSRINDYISGMTVKFYIFMAACCIIMLAFFAAFVILTRNDKAKAGAGSFRIEVDIEGNILSVDKNFKKHYRNISGNISNYVAEDFSGASVIIKVDTHDGKREYINCKKMVSKRSGAIFMGSDITTIYNEYNKYRMEHFTDEVTSMSNIQQLEKDFNDLVQTKNTKILGFIIYELNIEKYWALYGIEFYKKLLKVMSERIAEVYVWQAKPYYLTSDKFLVMIDENIKDVIAKIDSAIEFISAAARVDDLIIRNTCKAGYMIYNQAEEELNLSQIISRTELALSYARASNKKNYYGYVDNVMRSKQQLSNEDIKKIILEEEVNVCFQPQYSLSSERIVGFEALTRLSGQYNYINPGVFIENVEQAGAMVMLGDYILDKAMKFASELPDKNIKVSVNVSPLQLLGEKFVEQFMSRLAEYKLQPAQIGIEITETYEMSSMAKAREKLRELQKRGIHISIDDFGEKYSSLRYIKNLPINSIKIDKGYVDGVETEKYSRAIVQMIVELAKKLSLYSILEGVETRGQVDAVRELGADIIQGYIISPAIEPEKAMELIDTKRDLFILEEK